MNNLENLGYSKFLKDSITYRFNEKNQNKRNSSMRYSIINYLNNNTISSFPELEKEKFDENEEGLNIIYENIKFVYKEKRYDDIIKVVSQKEKFFCSNSIVSFNLLLMKIKSEIKNIQIQFEKSYNDINSKIIFYKIEKNLFNIQQDYDKLIIIANKNSKIQEEKSIQIYSKILYYYSYLWRLKDNYIKSLSYLSLALNLLKVYFIKYGIASQQTTYSIYAKILLFTISLLIEDNNYDKAIEYQNILFNVIFNAIKLQNFNEDNSKKIKFLYYLFYNFLLNGILYELLNEEIQAFDSFKQAHYISRKKIFNFEEPYVELSHRILIDFLNKFENDKEYKEKEFIRLIEAKKLNEINKKQQKKKEKLFLIANGYKTNINKFKNIEYKLKRLLSEPKQKEISKLDSELERFVYSNNLFNNNINSKEKSPEIKNHLCNYDLYSKLLTEEYKDFILENDNLLLNNPEKEKETIEKINKYINGKIEIQISKSKSEKILNPNDVVIEEKLIKNENKIKGHKKKSNSLIIDCEKINNKKYNFNTTLSSKNPSLFRINKKELPFDFERKYLDKKLLSKNYYNKYMRLEKLTTQELNFQKILLNFKTQHSKNYFSNELLSEDDIDKSNQRKIDIINNNVKNNLKKNNIVKEKIDIEIKETKQDSQILYNKVFKRKDKRFVGGSFSRVFKAYIKKMQKEREEKRKCNDPVYVRKRNEGQLLKINDEIDIISQILEEKKMKLKNKKYS